MKVAIPGVAITALITILVGALSGWLTQWVVSPYVPLVVILLGAIAKAAEIYFTDKAKVEAGTRALIDSESTHKVQRFFLGG
jgi:F0F1-type ATP synthase assembly protein I